MPLLAGSLDSNFNSPIYNFGWQDTQLLMRQVKVQSSERHFNHNIYRGKKPTGEKQLSIPFLPQKPRPFHLLTEKYGPNPSETDENVFVPAPMKYVLRTLHQKTFLNWEIFSKHSDKLFLWKKRIIIHNWFRRIFLITDEKAYVGSVIIVKFEYKLGSD